MNGFWVPAIMIASARIAPWVQRRNREQVPGRELDEEQTHEHVIGPFARGHHHLCEEVCAGGRGRQSAAEQIDHAVGRLSPQERSRDRRPHREHRERAREMRRRALVRRQIVEEGSALRGRRLVVAPPELHMAVHREQANDHLGTAETRPKENRAEPEAGLLQRRAGQHADNPDGGKVQDLDEDDAQEELRDEHAARRPPHRGPGGKELEPGGYAGACLLYDKPNAIDVSAWRNSYPQSSVTARSTDETASTARVPADCTALHHRAARSASRCACTRSAGASRTT